MLDLLLQRSAVCPPRADGKMTVRSQGSVWDLYLPRPHEKYGWVTMSLHSPGLQPMGRARLPCP